MPMSKKRYRAMIRLIAALLMVQMMSMTSQTHAQPAEGYSRTIEALQQRYADEVLAHRKFMAYSKQACEEGYRNIAHLFKSLAVSEAVHARNFKKLLSDLGAKVDPSLISGKITVASTSHNLKNAANVERDEIDREYPDILASIRPENHPKVDPSLISGKIAVASTSHNLKHAANVERDEIDREYPDILASIRPENHQEAITFIGYAWQAEKQHRDQIVKIEKAAVRWFGIIVNRIEGKDTTYHICNVCGSTLKEKPAKICPICKSDVSHYRSIAHWPLKICPRYVEVEEDPGD